MSVDRALGIKIDNNLKEYWSLLELDKLSYESKGTTVYKEAKELNKKHLHTRI